MSDGERGIHEFVSSIKHSAKKSLSFDPKGIKNASGDCHEAARETSATCKTTTGKARHLIDFAVETKGALDAFSGTINASDLAAVAKVASGDKMRTAIGVASEMDALALACVDQSVKMIDSIDAGVKTLPDILQKMIGITSEQANKKGSRYGDPEPPNIDPDLRVLEETVESVRDMNPLKAKHALVEAFSAISSKGERCRIMFSTIRDFAEDVAGVSNAIKEFKVGKMAGHTKSLVKDIWRCLRLSDLIKSFALAAKKLIRWIIKVLQAIRDKVKGIGMDLRRFGELGSKFRTEDLAGLIKGLSKPA